MSAEKTVKLSGFVYEVDFNDGREKHYKMLPTSTASDSIYTLIGPVEFNYHVPEPFNPVASKLAALDEAERRLRAKFAMELKNNGAAKENLLAITNEVEV